MAGGFGGPSVNKIKGGKFTVIRFFLVSMAFTAGWMTVSSLLGHYKLKYGPQILLQMNIAYFLPSIPLLILSSFLDEWLDKRFGIAKTILARLLFGLGGCATITAVWPLAHSSRRMLLLLVVVLGLVAGISFSASYQLVARFANKNTISLGLGCVGSGIVALLLELAVGLGPSPTRKQEFILFELTTAVIIIGAAAAFSLLIRHWTAIEASTPQQPAEAELAQPLMTEDSEDAPRIARSLDLASSRSTRKSLSLMLRHAPLDFFDNLGADAERMDDDALAAVRDMFAHQTSWKRKELDGLADDAASHSPGIGIPQSAFAEPALAEGAGPSLGEVHDHVYGEEAEQMGMVQLLRAVWPIMSALFLAGFVYIVVFPFFTYVPSSGLMGDNLPKVLFFVRLFADLTGRTLPRIKSLAATSQRLVFALACLTAATLPPFFLYLKAPPSFHNDYVIMAYIVALWGLLGYINTCAYILAPQRVPAAAKGAANGVLAIIYQASHCLGLVMAAALAVALFGDIKV